MKQLDAFTKDGAKVKKPFLKRTRLSEKQHHSKELKGSRIRAVLSVNAGHVRGGHGFH